MMRTRTEGLQQNDVASGSILPSVQALKQGPSLPFHATLQEGRWH